MTPTTETVLRANDIKRKFILSVRPTFVTDTPRLSELVFKFNQPFDTSITMNLSKRFLPLALRSLSMPLMRSYSHSAKGMLSCFAFRRGREPNCSLILGNFMSLRRFRVKQGANVNEIVELCDKEFIPILRKHPDFIAYYVSVRIAV